LYPIPENERERVAALRSYEILDTGPDIAYDEIGELAAQICQCPVAAVTFIDEERQWLKAVYGLPPEDNEIPREVSLCSHAICGTDLVIAPDLTLDPRFHDYPFVAGPPHFKFYCGVPLITPEGYALGTLVVMDFEPRELGFEQKTAMRRLSHQVMTQLALRRKVIELDHALHELDTARTEIAAEKTRSDDLLANILPVAIAEELKKYGKVEPRYYRSVSILFADVKQSTRVAETIEPAGFIALLDQYFSAFDEIVTRHGLEKIKTIGDAYMAVGGLPLENRSHPVDACLAALDMRGAVMRMNAQREKMRLLGLELRIGLHTGPVMAGVVGRQRFTYDIWGDAVNVAALMESHGEPGQVNLSETTAGYAQPYFELESRGPVAAKHKGALPMHFLRRLKPDYARDPDGQLPNDRLGADRRKSG
jgi:class 3 adenylate cyclase